MLPLALGAFFLSGVAALLYQIVWQRMLVLFTGSDVYSSTLIVAAFMAGLGLGHLAGGHLADRLSRRNGLLLFATAELAIASFSLISRYVYYDLLYQRLGVSALPAALAAAVLFGSLLWPTLFMGMSLPLLARVLTPQLHRAAWTVGALYGFNTLGAACGALAGTWLMLPLFGLERSLQIGSVLNLTCAVVVLPLAREKGEAELPPAPCPPPPSHGSGFRFGTWALLYALSGFLALSLEIVWFRLLGVIVKSTAFTFGTLLAVYLAGLGAGSLLGMRLASRVRHPAAGFLWLQAAVGLSAALLFGTFIGIADDVRWLRGYFANYEPLDVRESVGHLKGLMAGAGDARLPWQFALLYVVIPGFLIVPPTMLMGASFTVLQRVVQTDVERLGRRVGALLVANVTGSVLGAVLTGVVALNLLGVAATMKALAILSGGFAVLAIWSARKHAAATRSRARSLTVTVGMAGVIVVSILLVMPDAGTLWSRLHGTSNDRVVFGEDATGLSVLRLDGAGAATRTTVFVNGLGQSTLPFGDIHTALGLLPAFIHPDPKRVAIVGLGSGDTLYGAAGRTQIEHILCVEIIRPQLVTLHRLEPRYPYEALGHLLRDSRITHVAADGRLVLMKSTDRFDVIEGDALRPTSAYSGNLFSVEYFTLLRDRLTRGGLAATWAPTRRVRNAFVRVFPHVLSFPGMLIGSVDPIAFDRQNVVERLADARVREHYARAGIDLDALVRGFLIEPGRYTPDFDRRTLVDINTDLFPKDEFDLTLPEP